MVSTVKVTNITTPDGTGNVTFDRPLSGSGASLTSLPAANLTGSLPAISGASLTGITPSGQMVCKVWIFFDAYGGTVVVKDSYNVSSITDNGVGDYTINFSITMGNIHYASLVHAGDPNSNTSLIIAHTIGLYVSGTNPSTKSTTSEQLLCQLANASANYDVNQGCAYVVFGDS
jgi:hypothetical protein